jgi:hypothetical protein
MINLSPQSTHHILRCLVCKHQIWQLIHFLTKHLEQVKGLQGRTTTRLIPRLKSSQTRFSTTIALELATCPLSHMEKKAWDHREGFKEPRTDINKLPAFGTRLPESCSPSVLNKSHLQTPWQNPTSWLKAAQIHWTRHSKLFPWLISKKLSVITPMEPAKLILTATPTFSENIRTNSTTRTDPLKQTFSPD